MIRNALLFLALAASASVLAQPCTPNPLYADSVFGVWPDTLENFAPATLGQPYSQDLNLIVPLNAQDIDPTFPAVQIDSVVFVGVTGLPDGLSVACASQTPAPCTYLPSVLGCGLISGTPTVADTFPLTLDVTGYFTLFGSAVPYPLSFTGYRIIVTEDFSGTAELAALGLAGVRNVPNPVQGRTHIEFQLNRSSEVRVRVFNLLGDELWSFRSLAKAGLNRVPFEAGAMPEGVYLYKVETGREAFTGRMMVSR